MKIADAKISVPRAAPQANRSRRTYAQQFKQEIVSQCLVPGASVSAIALSHGINANVIRKWLPRREPGTAAALATMLPVTVEPVAQEVMGSGGNSISPARIGNAPAAPAAPTAPKAPTAATAAPAAAAAPAARGPGLMGTMGAVAVGAVAGSMAGNALAGGLSSDKETKAKEAEKEAQELQRKADEAKRKAEAARAAAK
ncbi:transposase [Polaromonas sp.]|uniref:transposase n=1 Tax=Polaromonas sp. TaxID=1869339 RepID=UPI00286A7013|nr:transposase [Polaromonas sp.]